MLTLSNLFSQNRTSASRMLGRADGEPQQLWNFCTLVTTFLVCFLWVQSPTFVSSLLATTKNLSKNWWISSLAQCPRYYFWQSYLFCGFYLYHSEMWSSYSSVFIIKFLFFIDNWQMLTLFVSLYLFKLNASMECSRSTVETLKTQSDNVRWNYWPYYFLK